MQTENKKSFTLDLLWNVTVRQCVARLQKSTQGFFVKKTLSKFTAFQLTFHLKIYKANHYAN